MNFLGVKRCLWMVGLFVLDTYLRERVINEETSVYFKCLFVCCEFVPAWRGLGEFYIHGMSLVVQIVTWISYDKEVHKKNTLNIPPVENLESSTPLLS